MKKLVVLSFLTLSFYSCGIYIGLAGGSINKYEETYKIENKSLDDIKKNIKKLKFIIEKEDTKEISFQKNVSYFETTFLNGKTYNHKIILKKLEDENYELKIILLGNFSEGTKEKSDEFYKEIVK